MTTRLLATVAVLVLLASGCTGDSDDGAVPGPGGSTVALDNPDLRQVKADAGIRDCAPGTAGPGSSALPAVTLACLGGGTSVDLSTLTGPMVINLWQAACDICQEEMPVLAEFDRTFGDQVPIIGVDYLDTFPGSALEDAADRGATYPQLADPGGDLGGTPAFARSSRGLPFTLFVDAQGEVAGVEQRGITSLDELTGLVDRYLGVDLADGSP